MNHKQFEEWLKLYLYEELSDNEKRLFEKHLEVCTQCKLELDEIKKLNSVLLLRKSVPIKEPLIQEVRRNLRLKVYDIKSKRSVFDKIMDALDNLLAPSLQYAFGGISLLAIGIFTGYLIFKSPTDSSQHFAATSAFEAGESQISNIRFIERNKNTGNIEFTFETITPVHIRGNINDEQVQKVLARALLSEQNAGVRLRAVNMIGSRAEEKRNGSPALDEEVKSSLINALLNDKNIGVRKEALNVLRNYLPDTVIVRAFLNVLTNEKNTGLKIAAINSLDFSGSKNQQLNNEILELLKEKSETDENNYIRIKAKTALQEIAQ